MRLLTGKYKYAVETAKGLNLDGTTEERDGKLFIKGTVATQERIPKSSRRTAISSLIRRRSEYRERPGSFLNDSGLSVLDVESSR